MTMKDSEVARKMEEMTDTMIISLMERLKKTDIKSDLGEDSSTSSSSPQDQMNEVLAFYDDSIEQLWKIADNICKTSTAEEEHAGTIFMGSSGDGTYLPEISDTYDTYVMEEDSQFEMQEDLEAIDSENANEMGNSKNLLKVLPTEKSGFFLITWTEYGLQLKAKHEAKQNPAQAEARVAKERKEIAIFERLLEYTDEIQHEGKTLPVISPFKIRQGYLSNPPTSIQGYPVWFRMLDQNSPAITLLTEEFKQNDESIRKVQVTDLVLGIRTTMPCLDHKWMEEKESSSKWLTKDLLSKLQESKSFVVTKSWESEQENLFIWRISYSVVERQCIKFLPREPKICLIIMKAIRRKFLSEPKGLVTYHLKTVLFYHLDKVGSDWEATDRARNILVLLDALAGALKNRSLPLFFEPGINTLGGMDEKTAAKLEMKTREILGSPRVLMSGILFQSMDESHRKEHFQKGKEEVVVWFDEKPPEPKLFSDEDLKD
ncbi:uncharacterized protein LOC116305325 [Actinia tenebrosa]|uniref:Uncharacterized protein LOC116305325 n=1 Tax=Actinia tenebrosa TaxID=6105 RepID=A0A6P8IVQ3_ACTTE|nr:uncharacterized protein LOC116305325 [Actinia tenebrosa]